MLQNIRKNAQGTAARIVVGVIIVVFALFGVESIVGSLSGEPEVATVNGEGIPESRFMRAVEGKRRQIMVQMGEQADPGLIDEGSLRSSVLEGMIQEEVLAQDADNKGLFVSDAAVDSYIRSVEQFKVDGDFSNDRMQVILRNAGLTLKDYRDSLKIQFVLGQPRTALIASAFVLDSERDEVVALDRQQRTFGVATVFKKDYLDGISVSDDDVSGYYKENVADYKKPENVDVSYIEINKADLVSQIDIEEEEIRTLYETEKAEYVGEEERQVSHILVKIDDVTNEEQALSKINDINAQLKAGTAFDVLAKAHSQDEASAADGGDLGLSARGVYVSDFEDAAFSLAVGDVSKPVKTEFGYHLIKLMAVESNSIPVYEEMRVSLLSRLQGQKTDQLYAEMTERLADLSYSSPDLEEPADELGLVVNQLAGVYAETQDPVFSNIKVQRVLFSDELLKDENNSELLEIGDGHSVVFRVSAYHEATSLPLEEVKERVREAIKENKAAEYAESVGQAFIVRVQAGETPEDVSEDMGLDWSVHEKIKRDNIMVNRELVSRVFTFKKAASKKENIVGFSALNGDYSVVMLTDIAEGDPETVSSLEKYSITNMLGDSFGASDYRSYQDALMKSAEVERI